MNNPMRWQQRFDNLERSYTMLTEICQMSALSEIEKVALIKVFELTFDLSWKTMKDYLEEEGFNLDSPRQVIKQAYISHLLTDGEGWLDVLVKRNIIVHNYNVKIMEETVTYIRERYFLLLRDLYHFFKQEQSQ